MQGGGDLVDSGDKWHNYSMETWFLIGGLVLVAVFNAVLAMALTRDRAKENSTKTALKLDELEADIAFLSGRLTKLQKQTAAGAAVEARQEAKSLKEQAMEQLATDQYPANADGRPKVHSFPGNKS